MKKKIVILGGLLLILVGAEIFLREYYGFCNSILLQQDADYEYIAKPNQEKIRFQNHIKYNEYSMRSNEIDTTSIKILAFGDSVINGGVLTDQDSLATTILSNTLSKRYHKNTQVLNISSGSWGPDNCYAYLQKHGNFDAQMIFLIISSHDAYDNMNFEENIGEYVQLRGEQYSFALYELFDRYIIPKIKKKYQDGMSEDGRSIDKKQPNSQFNSGFQNFLNYSRSHNIPFIIYLHADQYELTINDYKKEGQEIIQFAKENNVPIILDLKQGLQFSDFRDGIHLNEQGQQHMAENILDFLATQKQL